jgi:hypothetical protein
MNYYTLFVEFLSLSGETVKTINLEVLYELVEKQWIKFINLLNELKPNYSCCLTLTDSQHRLIVDCTEGLNSLFDNQIGEKICTFIKNFMFEKFGYSCDLKIKNSSFNIYVFECCYEKPFNKLTYEIESRTGFENMFSISGILYLNMDYLCDALYENYLKTVREIKKNIENIILSDDQTVITIDNYHTKEIIELLLTFRDKISEIIDYIWFHDSSIYGMMHIVAHLGIAHIKNKQRILSGEPIAFVLDIYSHELVKFNYYSNKQ